MQKCSAAWATSSGIRLLRKIIKAVCQKTGGNGGGRPDSAMGGVGDPLLVEDAMSTLPDLIHEMLK